VCVCVCVCDLVTKGKGTTTFPKSPYQEGKKEWNSPYLEHRFLYVANIHSGV